MNLLTIQDSNRKNSPLREINEPNNQVSNPLRKPISRPSKQKNNPRKASAGRAIRTMRRREVAAVAAEPADDLRGAGRRTMRSLPAGAGGATSKRIAKITRRGGQKITGAHLITIHSGDEGPPPYRPTK